MILVYEEDEAAKVRERVQHDIQEGHIGVHHVVRDEDSGLEK